MLIIAGTITINPADVERFSGAAATMMAATHEEPGCHAYVFSEDVSTPGSIQVFEVWESAEALAAHFEMQHMTDFRAVLGDLDIQGRDISRYEVSSAEPM